MFFSAGDVSAWMWTSARAGGRAPAIAGVRLESRHEGINVPSRCERVSIHTCPEHQPRATSTTRRKNVKAEFSERWHWNVSVLQECRLLYVLKSQLWKWILLWCQKGHQCLSQVSDINPHPHPPNPPPLALLLDCSKNDFCLMSPLKGTSLLFWH